MWRALLGLYCSSAHALPRYTWELEVDADIKVAEIVSVSKWVDFVCAYPRYSEDGGPSSRSARIASAYPDSVGTARKHSDWGSVPWVYPDWASVAREFDAVHITLPAIAGSQGFHFETPKGVIPPAFWDVETTFWLRWCFSGVRLVETEGEDDLDTQ
jgi:hypothetical protein